VDTNEKLIKELEEGYDELDANGDLMAVKLAPHEVFEQRKKAEFIKARTNSAEGRELQEAVDAEICLVDSGFKAVLENDPKIYIRWKRNVGDRVRSRKAKEAAAATKARPEILDKLDAKLSGKIGKNKQGGGQRKKPSKHVNPKSEDQENQPPPAN